MTRKLNLLLCAGAVALCAVPVTGQTSPQRPAGGGSGVASRAGSPAGVPTTPEYRIGPADVLDVVVWMKPELSSTAVHVRPDGKISLTRLNDIQAAGLTPMELAAEITKRIDAFFKDQEVSVTVREINSLKVSVIGSVRTPNQFLLRSQMTVLDALALAGGLVDFAEKEKIYVLRGGKPLPFNYRKFMDSPGSVENFLLMAGDILIVPGS